ncbi:MAG: hypothetical protein K5882_03310 [Bacteroidales bacterium]|jgi:hypothetical protein|nr:hypothetical protein [Bacteroidales bacterium]
MKKTTHINQKIKNILQFGLFVCCIAILMSSCDLFNRKEKFDKTLLSGCWVSGTLYEYYNADGTGHTWDILDDVTEEEAQPFTWTLEKRTLTQIHQMEMGGNVPKIYTVTKLNATTLEYHDDYGKYYTFTKEK